MHGIGRVMHRMHGFQSRSGARHPCTGYLDHPFKNKPFETEKNLHPLLANTAEWAFLDAIWGIVWPVVPLPVVPLKHVDPPLYASRRESCTMVD